MTANQILKALENPEVAAAVENLKRHRENKVYIEAAQMFLKTQEQQIQKGAEKYPEPLNPSSWTIDQLAQHAFDELVDQSHYIKALQFKGKQLEGHLNVLEGTYKGILEDNEKLVADNMRWKHDCKEYAEKLDIANERLHQASQDIARLNDLVGKYKRANEALARDEQFILHYEQKMDKLKTFLVDNYTMPEGGNVVDVAIEIMKELKAYNQNLQYMIKQLADSGGMVYLKNINFEE